MLGTHHTCLRAWFSMSDVSPVRMLLISGTDDPVKHKHVFSQDTQSVLTTNIVSKKKIIRKYF